ncbi:hypothetical protein DFJ58DRAFT_729542 [Suillus subalutaceus]|uniref:uncharacterized protein n=1 Tax=Suillus subalutaceus TaxID=48586 RepID=UPI001B876DE0|nr:uncharacterized protein DFJ58DRAFT_729542 [Suillus subalutaceus]KAG1849464.1 hypothetical protein DFJ58DRAFT_729542 [Suillus subalutaceus]
MPSKGRSIHTYHPLLQSTSYSLQSASVTGQAASSCQEADALEQSQALKDLKNSSSGDNNINDILMMPPPSFFDPAKQPPFTPSTPGASSMCTSVAGTSAVNKGKRKEVDNGDDACKHLFAPPIPPSHKIQGLTKGLTSFFDRATNILEERTRNTPQFVDLVPLRKQKAILQVQDEGLEDHEVVTII